MTVIGIAGCTSLLLSGFGLKDSITAIAGKQFDEISVYDAMVLLDTESAPDTRDLNRILGQDPQVKGFLPLLSENVTVQPAGSSRTHEVNLTVPQDVTALGDYTDLQEGVWGRRLRVTSDGPVISGKLAELMKVGPGETLTWQDSEKRSYRVKVAGVAENYLAHYMFMSPEVYAQAAFQDPVYNAAAFNLVQPDAVDAKAFRSKLLENEGVLGAMFTRTIADTFNDTVRNLNYVVMVLILSAVAPPPSVSFHLPRNHTHPHPPRPPPPPAPLPRPDHPPAPPRSSRIGAHRPARPTRGPGGRGPVCGCPGTGPLGGATQRPPGNPAQEIESCHPSPLHQR